MFANTDNETDATMGYGEPLEIESFPYGPKQGSGGNTMLSTDALSTTTIELKCQVLFKKHDCWNVSFDPKYARKVRGSGDLQTPNINGGIQMICY